MSEIPLRFRKKQYEIGTDSQSGVVTFDSEGKRILVEDDVYGASKLEQLTDVEIGTLAGGQVLMYNAIGSKWENTDGIKAFYDCVFTLTPDPNADPDAEFPNNTLITCNRTPSEIAAAFGNGKEISASLLMTDGEETTYGPVYGSLNFVAAPQLGTDVVGFIFPFMALGIVDIWIHNTDATQDWSADFSRYTLKVYRDNNDEPTNEILIDRYGGTSFIRIPQTLNGLDGVTISTAENGQVISYNGSQWVNTSLATVATSGSYNDLTGRPTIGSGILTISQNSVTIGTFSANETSDKTINIEATALYEETTYSILKSKVDNGTLVPGAMYRITDYVTTTNSTNNLSTDTYTAVNAHAFDLVVTATGINKLDCMAQALPHSGDTYFSTAGADLTKWQVWYDINNDTTKYTWADSTNGKGVIYRMIDEWDNDCPYDFKNIQFKRKLDMGVLDTASGTDTWVYTFNLYDQENSTQYDASVSQFVVENDEGGYTHTYGNVIKRYGDEYNNGYSHGYPYQLNDIVFCNFRENDDYFYGCYFNTFGIDCYNNTFGNYCYNTTFGDKCSNNTLGDGCYNTTFGDGCYDNTFWAYCDSNTFGDSCYRNTFGYNCSNNTFGNWCYSNTFGNLCDSNTFGNNCYSNTFGIECDSNTFGDGCFFNTFGNSSTPSAGGNYCRRNIVEKGNQYIRLYQTINEGSSNYLQNIYIAQGVNNTAIWLDISTIARNLSYRTTVARESNGTLRIYNEDDPLTLATVAVTGSYNDLTDKPTIPDAANTGVLTIQRNGVTMGTFGANDASNKTVNLTLATVATTGIYNDLTDRPVVKVYTRNTVTVFASVNNQSGGTVTVNGQAASSSGISIPVSGGGTAQVTLVATPIGDSVFQKWQSSSNGSNWADVSGATNATYAVTPASGTYYYRAVFVVNVTITAVAPRLLDPAAASHQDYSPVTLKLGTNEGNYNAQSITVQEGGTVYVKEYKDNEYWARPYLSYDYDNRTGDVGAYVACEVSTDNGNTWYLTSPLNHITVSTNTLVRAVQTGETRMIELTGYSSNSYSYSGYPITVDLYVEGSDVRVYGNHSMWDYDNQQPSYPAYTEFAKGLRMEIEVSGGDSPYAYTEYYSGQVSISDENDYEINSEWGTEWSMWDEGGAGWETYHDTFAIGTWNGSSDLNTTFAISTGNLNLSASFNFTEGAGPNNPDEGLY